MTVERIGCPDNRKEFITLMKELKSHIVIIKFYAEWCNPCKSIFNLVENEFDNIHSTNKILMYVNIDKTPDICSYLKIRKLPTLISYKNGLKDQILQTSNPKDIYIFFKNI